MIKSIEAAIIGSILYDNSTIKDCWNITPDMFSDPVLGKVFEVAKKDIDDGKGVDLPVLASRIDEYPEDYVNEKLFECVRSDYNTVNIKRYARALEEQSKDKELHNYLAATTVTIRNAEEVAEHLHKISEFRNRGTRKKADSLVKENKGRCFSPDRSQGISLGYPNIDGILHNIDGGDLCIIAARPAVGKSALSTEIALNMAKAGHKVILFNLEMTNDQIYDRMISHESGIKLQMIRRSTKISDREYDLFEKGNESLEKLDLYVVDDLFKVSDMIPEMDGMDVAVIDYAQLIKPESRYAGNRYAEMGEVSHSIKQTAKKLNIPIILLCQLNRAKNEFTEPSMSELRETGDFEQDANQIIMLWNKDDDRKRKGVKVEKNRQGKTGTTELMFNGDIMTFTETDEDPFD